MALNRRERLLALGAGAVALVIVGQLVYSAVMAPIDQRQSAIASRGQELEKRARRGRNVRHAQRQLADWNGRALPSNAEAARLLYKTWLLELVKQANFRKEKIESAEGRLKRGAYTSLPFTVRGQANLEELTTFLHAFYSADYMQQIRRLSVKPVEKTSDFDVVMTIEALSLPTADNEDKLPAKGEKALAGGPLADYQKAIVQRNLFSPPKPVRPVVVEEKRPEPAGPPPVDPAKFVYVTAITAQQGQSTVWLKARTTDEKFMLAEGEQFQVGPTPMKIVRIGRREVEVEIDGQRRVVPLGEPVQNEPRL